MDRAERLRLLDEVFPLAGSRADPTPSPEPRTYDYTHRYWGHDYLVTGIIDGGQTVKLCVFGRFFKVGDFLILQQGKGSTRYRIAEITSRPPDPGDQWFIVAEFAPREIPSFDSRRPA